MLNLPSEINILISCEFSQKEILELRLVNSYFESIFQSWLLYNEIEFNNEIYDEMLGMLSFLNYRHTSINLFDCKKITDEGLQYLTNCSSINLFGCSNITDEGLQYLTNCTSIIT